MAALSFNATQHEPSYGSSMGMLPPCKKTKVIIHSSELKPTRDSKGGYLELGLKVVEGPLTGREGFDRLQLNNVVAKTVEIANGQLSAYCAVTGVPSFTMTEQLHNIPFLIDVDWQKGNEPTQEKPEGGYTEVKALYDANGNKPGARPGKPNAATPPALSVVPPAAVQPASPAPAWVQQPTAEAAPVAAGWGQR